MAQKVKQTKNKMDSKKKRLAIALGISIPLVVAGVTTGIVFGVKSCKSDTSREIELDDTSKTEGIKISSTTTASGDIEITLTPDSTSTKKVEGIKEITIGNTKLSDTDYTFDKTTGKVTIKKEVLDKNPGKIVVTPTLAEKEVPHVKINNKPSEAEIDDSFDTSATITYSNVEQISWTQDSSNGGTVEFSKTTTFSDEVVTITGKTSGTVKITAKYDDTHYDFFNLTIKELQPSPVAYFEGVDYETPSETECMVKLSAEGLTKAENLVIPETIEINNKVKTVTGLPSYAFLDESTYTWGKLTGLKFAKPENIKTISPYAFVGAISLISVTWPSHITEIPNNCFLHCLSLKSFDFTGIQKIDECAFDACTSLSDIFISNSVTSIAENPFQNCTGIKSIKVDTSNTIYTSVDADGETNSIIRIQDNALVAGCVNSRISDTLVKTLDAYCFCGLTNLQTINLGKIVTIGTGAFSCCGNLTSIIIPKTCKTIGESAFSMKEWIDPWEKTKLSSIAFEDNSELETICEAAFFMCDSLKTIELPAKTKTIEKRAFGFCTDLESVTIPASATSIADRVFISCSSLTSVTFNDTNNWVTKVDKETADVTDPGQNAANFTDNHPWHLQGIEKNNS